MLKRAALFVAGSIAFAGAMSASCTYGTQAGGSAATDASGPDLTKVVKAGSEEAITADDGTLVLHFGSASFTTAATVRVTSLPARQLNNFTVPAYEVRADQTLVNPIVVELRGNDNHSGEGRLVITLDDKVLPFGGHGGQNPGGNAGPNTQVWGVAASLGVFSLTRVAQNAPVPVQFQGGNANDKTCAGCCNGNRGIYESTCFCESGLDLGCILSRCKAPLEVSCKAGTCNNATCGQGQVCCYQRNNAQPFCTSDGNCSSMGGFRAACDVSSCPGAACCVDVENNLAKCEPSCTKNPPRCDGASNNCGGSGCSPMGSCSNISVCGGNIPSACAAK